MTDGSLRTMAGAAQAAYLNRIDRERRDAAFDKAVAECRRVQQEHRKEDIDVVVKIIDAVADLIFAQPIKTLGDCRLFARAWLGRHRDDLEDHERRLLEALEALPERLWSEPIASG